MKLKINWAKVIYITMVSLLVWRILTGCNTEYRAEKIINKWSDKQPTALVKIANIKLPCIPLVTQHDSTNYKQWIDSINQVVLGYQELLNHIEPYYIHDTTNTDCDSINVVYANEINQLVDYSDKLLHQVKHPKSIHDTFTIKDTRDLYFAIKSKDSTQLLLNKSVSINEIIQNKLSKYEKIAYYSGGFILLILICFLGWKFCKIYFSKLTILTSLINKFK